MPDLEDESDEWEVEDIVGDQRYKRQSYFLVKWKGWPSEYNQWVLEEDISTPDIMAKYRRTRSTKKKKKRTSIWFDSASFLLLFSRMLLAVY